MASAATAAAAGAVARARREVLAHFADAEAFDPARAVPFQPASRLQQRQYERLLGEGVLQLAGDGRCWLDRAALEAQAARRVQVVKWSLAIVAGVAVIALALAAIQAYVGS